MEQSLNNRQFNNLMKRKYELLVLENCKLDPGSFEDFDDIEAKEWLDPDPIICENNSFDELYDTVMNENDDFYIIEYMKNYYEDPESSQKSDFDAKFRKWFYSNGISYKAGNEILNIYIEFFQTTTPKTVRTILQVPREQIVQQQMKNGVYYHFGIEEMLIKYNMNFLNDIDCVQIDIGIDGVPLYKSSRTELWPIIGRFVDRKKVPPFLIGAWCGPSKPIDSNEYLRPLAEEILKLNTNGVLVTKRKLRKQFEVRVFVCDTVARSALKGVLGHGSILGCQNCDLNDIVETDRRTFPTIAGPPRDDKSFRERKSLEHHHENYQKIGSHVLESCNINMVSQFALDPMHMLDLGIGKKILGLIYNNLAYKTKLSVEIKRKLNMYLLVLAGLTPSDFARTTRTLVELFQWKSTEFRQFMLYTGIVALKDYVHPELYYHFLMVYCGYRLISDPKRAKQNVAVAQKLFEKFVEFFPKMYGSHKVSFNVHNLLHVCLYIAMYGSADSISAYSFEGYMQELKKGVRKPQQILQQIYNRFSAISTANETANSNTGFTDPYKNCEPFPGCHSSFSGYKFDEYLLSNKPSDSCCLIGDNIFIEIEEFAQQINGRSVIIGQRYKVVRDFFEQPLKSLTDLGIAYCEELSVELEVFAIDQVTTKFYRVPYGQGFVLIPILHWRNR